MRNLHISRGKKFVKPFWHGAVFLALICGSASCRSEPNGFGSGLRRFPADGTSGGNLVWRGPGRLFGPLLADAHVLERVVQILDRRDEAERVRISFRSGGSPGTALWFSTGGDVVVLRFLEQPADLDGDGFPDAAELVSVADRRAFRAWFVRIAEAQFVSSSYAWRDDERDCSGLIRFAYREALKRHDSDWQQRLGLPIDKNLPDVQRFQYPDVPVLGTRIFRVGKGPENFAEFAEAAYLASFHTQYVSKDIADALAGDVLFYFDAANVEFPYHSMIVTAPAREAGDVMIVYHTGGEAGLKRVPADYLLGSPDPAWQPAPENENFLGVHRFAILE